MISFVCCPIILTSQIKKELIKLPDCQRIAKIKFDVENIYSNEKQLLFESSLDSLESLYCFSKSIGDTKLEATSLNILGEFYLFDKRDERSFQTGINYLLESERICEEFDYYNTWLNAKEVLSDAFTMNQMFDYALITTQEILELAKDHKDSVRIAEGNMILGRILREQKEYEKSDSVLHLALSYLNNKDYSKRIGAYAYLHLSNLKRLEGKFVESLNHAKKGLEFLNDYSKNDKSGIQAFLATEIILTEIELGIYENPEMLKILENVSTNGIWFKIQYHHIKANLLERNGEHDEALLNYVESLEISDVTGSPLNAIRTSESIFELLKEQKSLDRVTQYTIDMLLQAQKKLIGQHENNNYYKAIYLGYENEMKIYENERLKKENDLLSQKNSNNIILTLLSFVILAFLTLSFLFIQNKRFNSQIQESNRAKAKLNEELSVLNEQFAQKNLELNKSNKSNVILIEELNESNESLDHFASIAAHDIQAPIKTIGGYVKLISKHYGNKMDENHVEWLNYVIGDTNRLISLIQNLLNFSKLTLHLGEKEKVNLNEIIQICRQQLSSEINPDLIKIKVEKDLPTIVSYKSLIIQLFMNLIGNSVKYSKTNSINYIVISWKNIASNMLEIQISDTGVGIPQLVMPSVFNMFSKHHKNKSGNGIGLATCEKIVNFFGGEIKAESVENEWTKVVFTLELEEK